MKLANLLKMMFRDNLDKKNRDPHILMFCGKGGVGKTTCASLAAIHYAERGYRTLLLSTDPSPSLSDILDSNVMGAVTYIPGVENLEVVELDYDQIVEMWKEKFGEEVYQVIASFLPVERDIIEYVAGAPGIDEEFALSYVYDFYKSGEYDIIVWDTAPAGGTLSLLHIQENFYNHMRDAARLYIKVRETLKSLTGKEKREPLKIIKEWEQLARNVLDMVRSERTTAFLVTLPEALGVNQTDRVKKELEKFDISVRGIIINKFIPSIEEVSEFFKKRREVNLRYLKVLEEKYGDELPIMKLPLQEFDVKGLEALRKMEGELFSVQANVIE